MQDIAIHGLQSGKSCEKLSRMPLKHENQNRLLTTQGYCELGMLQHAGAELEIIDAEVWYLPEVHAVRVEIYRGLKKWDLMQALAKKLA